MMMHVTAITNMPQFEQLRQDWDAVYGSDPEAQFFLSWGWMSGRLRDLATPWIVLAARPAGDASPAVAFLPLLIQGGRTEVGARRGLTTAGSPVADYTGFICRPGHEAQALPAFATALRMLAGRLPWDALTLTGIRASEGRLRIFLSRFAGAGFRVAKLRRDNGDGIDNAVCPHVDLPDSWEDYLSAAVSSGTRQKIRRFLRRIDSAGEFSVTEATPATAAEDIEVLLHLWREQWGERKQERAERIHAQTRAMLMRCCEDGSLFLPILRWNGQPVGALGILVDPVKRSYLFYIGGRDRSFAELPPGFCLHALAIRHAIAQGFRTYDFLRGDEPYKFLFGAKPHPITSIVVHAPPAAGAADSRLPGTPQTASRANMERPGA
jgi:CelD/BcsL family acetyltransferase involved in cellulose biosynthesis